jgi:MFS superfamily sulfate permease-like transporter
MSGQKRRWLSRDLIAGATLTAIAVPEVMGYAKIAKIPVVTGLYTLVIPVVVFAIFRFRSHLVVGGSSVVAAVLASGLGGAAIAGVLPESQQWLAYVGVIALVCAAMLLVAGLCKLGFLADLISVPVAVGLYAGIGIFIASREIPGTLGLPTGNGTWLAQQWANLNAADQTNWKTVAFALGTAVIVLGCRRFWPNVPGSLLALVLGIAVSTAVGASASGVAVIGDIPAGLPPLGLPEGVGLNDLLANSGSILLIAASCFFLIIVETAVTTRSVSLQTGVRAQLDRDLVSLSGSNLLAGLGSTMAVSGSATKTQFLSDERGRTQLANLTMALLVLLLLIFSSLLAKLPIAVISMLVFILGCRMVNVKSLRQIFGKSRLEFVAAINTAIITCVFGVQYGVAVAIIFSILHVFKHQWSPGAFVVGLDGVNDPTYTASRPGLESQPGLIVFRYTANLFFANASTYADAVRAMIAQAPHPVEWFVIDGSSLGNIDYSGGVELHTLFDFLEQNEITLALARADQHLSEVLSNLGLDQRIAEDRRFATLPEVYAAFNARR